MVAPAPLNIKILEDALFTWFKTQTGITNVRWADQDSPSFDYPYGLVSPLTGFIRNANAFDYKINSFNTILSDIVQNYTIVTGISDTLTITLTSKPSQTVVFTAGIKTAAQIVLAINSLPVTGLTASISGGKVMLVSANDVTFKVTGNAEVLFDFEVVDIIENHRGYRDVTVSFQAYVGTPDNNNPIKNANYLLSLAQGSLSLQSVTDTFRQSGIAVIEDLGITRLDRFQEDTYISVANLDVRFMVASSVYETLGYIKKIKLSGDLSNPDYDFTDLDVGDLG